MGKASERQTKTIKDQEEEQTKTIKEKGEKQIKAIESTKGFNNKSHKIFDELSYKRMSEIKDLSKQIDLNNLTYFFKDKSISPINVIGFKAPLHLHRDIFNGNTELAKAEEDQEQFESVLKEITRGNPRKKSEHQVKTIKTLKIFMNQEKKLSNCVMIMLKLDLKVSINQNMEKDLKC